MTGIAQELRARFDAPLPDLYPRRIVVWLDEDGEFGESARENAPENVRFLAVEENRLFELRRQIEVDFAREDILLYCPRAYDQPEENALLDVFLYAETFRADYASLLLSELGAENTPALRAAVRAAKQFFRSRERRERLRAMGPFKDEGALYEAMLCAACCLRAGGLNAALRAVLAAPDGEENAPLAAMARLVGPDAFWDALAARYGYDGEREARPLACALLVAAARAGAAQEAFDGLPCARNAAAAYAFFAESLREDEALTLRLCREVEEDCGVPARLARAERGALLAHRVFPCADALLLRGLLTAFAGAGMDADEAQAVLAARRDAPWHALYAPYYAALRALTDMRLFSLKYRRGFHFADADALWHAYERELHAMDQAYRRFVCAHGEAIRAGIFQLEDELRAASDAAERLYKNGFLFDLSAAWSAALARPGALDALHAPRQADFYSARVRGAQSRVFVVVSDALRYEAGAEIAAALNAALPGNASCTAMRAAYPTLTGVGMAALLPHVRLTLGDDLRVRADGPSTESADREAALQAACPQSAAVDYAAFRRMNRAQRAELVRPLRVLYVYHNTVDRAGEAGGDPLAACETAKEELVQLMRILVGELSAATAYITADHGFLYTRAPLEEYERAGRELVGAQPLQYARRCAVVRSESCKSGAPGVPDGEDGAEESPLLALPLTELGRPDLTALFPRGNLRFRLQGGGGTYMHGGLALQELAVPLIEYRNKKAGQKGFEAADKVDVTLTSPSRRISNNLFTLAFYQAQPCTPKRTARTAKAQLLDGAGRPVSDAHRIVADSAEQDNSRRVIRATFRLTGSGYDRSATYYLTLTDEETGETLSREPFSVDVAFEQDFDF